MKRLLTKTGVFIGQAVIVVVLLAWWTLGANIFSTPYGWLHMPKGVAATSAPSATGSESEPAPSPSSSDSEPADGDVKVMLARMDAECSSVYRTDLPRYRECAKGFIAGAIEAWNPQAHAWWPKAMIEDTFAPALARNAGAVYPKVMGLGVDVGAAWAKQAGWKAPPDAMEQIRQFLADAGRAS